MNGFLADVAAPLTVASIVLVAGLSTLLVVARQRRNRRETRQHADRIRLIAALKSGDLARVADVVQRAAGSARVREELVEALRITPSSLPGLWEVDGRDLAAACVEDIRRGDATARGLAAELLAQIGAEADLAEVNRVLRHDSDPEIRRVAARGLARRGDETAAWLLIDALVEEVLPFDRILEQLGHPYATATLVDALHLEQLRPVHADLADAIGLARDQRAVFAVARLLRDGDERERVKACRALGRIGRHEVVPMLVDALADPSKVVRAVAARSLGEIGDGRAVGALAERLGDASWWVRANAAESLRHSGAAGVAALTSALAHDDPRARDRAAEALALHHAAVGRRRAV